MTRTSYIQRNVAISVNSEEKKNLKFNSETEQYGKKKIITKRFQLATTCVLIMQI